MERILWHRRESRRKTEKTNIFLQPWEASAYSKGWEIGRWKAEKMKLGSWEAGKLGGWEDEKWGGGEVGRLGGSLA